MPLTYEPASGEIVELGVRYLMIRPDVLMGVAHELLPKEAASFLRAIERSAFRRAQSSFQHYRTLGAFCSDELLAKSLTVAAQLGWGVWTLGPIRTGSTEVLVRNSPFAAGYGQSSVPVCGAITGVLRAMLLVAYGTEIEVHEVACSAQGEQACKFNLVGVPKGAGPA